MKVMKLNLAIKHWTVTDIKGSMGFKPATATSYGAPVSGYSRAARRIDNVGGIRRFRRKSAFTVNGR